VASRDGRSRSRPRSSAATLLSCGPLADDEVEVVGISHQGYSFDEEKSALDNVFAFIPKQMQTGLLEVKEEVHEEEEADDDVHPIECRLDLIKQLSKGASRFDPAQNPAALSEAKWQKKVFSLDVQSLKLTHDEVNLVVFHGPQRGQRVDTLVEELRSGDTRVESITPLVVVRCLGDDWVVCGNRRLKALKEFAATSQRPVFMSCIVHEGKRGENFPIELFAKFLDALSTTNGGMSVSYCSKRW
jgi:hypothetical protein